MSGIAIYMEGGGKGPGGRSTLRQGMNTFLAELKEAARKISWRWKFVCCGSRDVAFRMFRHAQGSMDYSVVVLLVDSEGPVTGIPRRHLNERDGWNMTEMEEDRIHLMVQTMETWIVSDVEALRRYYGSDFTVSALPRSIDLEEVTKTDIARALERATARTTKGEYHKIRHASDLLKQISPRIVRERCSYCDRLFELLGQELRQATGS